MELSIVDRLRARTKVVVKGFGPGRENWLNRERNLNGKLLYRQKLGAQNLVELREAIGDPA